MHNRRSKKKLAKQAKDNQPPAKVNFMTTVSDITPKQAEALEVKLEEVDKFDLERFTNPITREETFKLLFDEV